MNARRILSILFSRWALLRTTALVLVLVNAAGCTHIDDSERSANPSTIPPSVALSAAHGLQQNHPDSSVGEGAGTSMKPIYGDGTYFVIVPIAFDSLKPGMDVSYRDAFGDQIVHRLKYKEDGGWVVEGLNNQTRDKYRVTPDNLVGYVYSSWQTNVLDDDN
jgi:hypothetical protein